MPKITTVQRVVAGNRIKIDIWYNTSDYFYIKNGLPVDMETFCRPYDKLTGIKTQAVLESLLDELIQAFNKAESVERKVIYVSAELTPGMCKAINLAPNHPLHRSGFSQERPKFGFELAYVVLTERTIGGQKSYFTAGGSRYIDVSRADILLDHTDQREEFFQRVIEATKKMGAAMAEFFGTDTKALSEKIDNGQKLLG